MEAGLSTLAQDYVRVLADYVMGSVTGATLVEQDTVPEWVQYTAYLAKYLVSDYMSYIHDYTVYLCRIQCMPPVFPIISKIIKSDQVQGQDYCV